MSKLIKIMLSIVLCVFLVFNLSSCEKNTASSEESYGDYYDGYVDGYRDGVIEGQEELGSYASYRFDDACGIVYGIEEALTILNLYADGESFSEEEIFEAIQIVNSFYDDVCDVIHDVENYYDE